MMATPDDIEAQFYEALQHGDIDQLMAAWADDDEIVCVLPGSPRFVGSQAIRTAFEALLAHGGVPVRLQQVRRIAHAGAAVHHLVAAVDLKNDKGVHTAWVIVTNVYLKTDQGWRLVAHHASPGTEHETPEVIETPSVLH
jgi:uncharacterized protein (TIGR02246 family)